MRLVAIIALVLVALPARADDDRIEVQRMRFIERSDSLTVTGNLSKLFDQAAYEQLSSGFPSTIAITTQVIPRDGGTAYLPQIEIRTVVYDLWDEQYVIRIEGLGAKRTRKVKYRAEALKIITALDDFPIAPLSDIPYEKVYYLRITAQLNPVSPETLAEVRRWLSQGTGGGLDRGGVFFGSFVSVFVNPKIADADRVLKIRSQPFYRPKP